MYGLLTVTITDEEKALIGRMAELLKVVDEWMANSIPEPQSGSSLAGDDARTDPYRLSHSVMHSLAIAIDHLHSLRMALISAPSDINIHTYAPFTQMRAALENASSGLWILAPASRRERILRRLLIESDSIANAESLLADTSVRTDSGITARKQRILDVADRNQILHTELAKKYRPSYTDIVKEAGIRTELHDKEMNYIYLMWRLCSAVATATDGSSASSILTSWGRAVLASHPSGSPRRRRYSWLASRPQWP